MPFLQKLGSLQTCESSMSLDELSQLWCSKRTQAETDGFLEAVLGKAAPL